VQRQDRRVRHVLVGGFDDLGGGEDVGTSGTLEDLPVLGYGVAGLAAVDDLGTDELDPLGRLCGSPNAPSCNERALPGDDGKTVVAQREFVALGWAAQGLADRGIDARANAQIAAQVGGEDAGPQLAIPTHFGADEIDELASAEETDIA